MAAGGGDGGFKFEEKKGDLFACPETDSLVHCVSADLRMEKGIAVAFKKIFRGVEELRSQGKKTGQVAVLKKGDRFIYSLITKPKASGTPSYKSIEASLKKLKEHCVDNKVRHLSMPRIGSGLDSLDWGNVTDLICKIFEDTNIQITVYHTIKKKKVGQVAVLERKPRFIYYLITKVKVTERPTYYNLKASLEDLKKHCVDNGVQTLAMPHLGCGLNRLVWGKVKTIICEVFANTKIHITVYVLECQKKLPYNDCTQGNCMRII